MFPNPAALDAMGFPFSTWLVAIEGPDGRLLRDSEQRVIYETQAQRAQRLAALPAPAAPAAEPQLDLFA